MHALAGILTGSSVPALKTALATLTLNATRGRCTLPLLGVVIRSCCTVHTALSHDVCFAQVRRRTSHYVYVHRFSMLFIYT
jgi:hypothetical protein